MKWVESRVVRLVQSQRCFMERVPSQTNQGRAKASKQAISVWIQDGNACFCTCILFNVHLHSNNSVIPSSVTFVQGVLSFVDGSLKAFVKWQNGRDWKWLVAENRICDLNEWGMKKKESETHETVWACTAQITSAWTSYIKTGMLELFMEETLTKEISLIFSPLCCNDLCVFIQLGLWLSASSQDGHLAMLTQTPMCCRPTVRPRGPFYLCHNSFQGTYVTAGMPSGSGAHAHTLPCLLTPQLRLTSAVFGCYGCWTRFYSADDSATTADTVNMRKRLDWWLGPSFFPTLSKNELTINKSKWKKCLLNALNVLI